MKSTGSVNNFEKPASRVTILDAVDLDSEIQRILKEHLLKIVHSISPSSVKWEPELNAFLRFIIWKVVHVVGWLDLWVQVATLVNLLVFLRQGQFPTLPDRLTGLRTVCADPTVSRVVGYSFMTRELLWHGFIELIVFILPLVNYKYIQRCLIELVGLRRSQDQSARLRRGLVYSVATRCAVCQEPPVLPHHMGCAHAFCYYCLQSNRMADPKFECPNCGHSTVDDDAIQPVSSRHFVHL